ncbi:MAG: DNA glycosylase AlkZ-like family protein, partial [Planctomycetota bacterium]
METLTVREARRLALARAGLLKPEWTGFPRRAAGRGKRARDAAAAVIGRFGYLQLDTVSIAGARSHAIVLLSRLDGFDPALGEELLCPGAPLFEYWGHEASWI